MPAIGIDAANHHLVTKHKVEVDFVCRNLNLPVATGYAGQHQDAIFPHRLHGIEHDS